MANFGEPGGGPDDWTLYHAQDGSPCAYSGSLGIWMFTDGSTSANYTDYPGVSITAYAQVAQSWNNFWTAVRCLNGRYASGCVRGGSGMAVRG